MESGLAAGVPYQAPFAVDFMMVPSAVFPYAPPLWGGEKWEGGSRTPSASESLRQTLRQPLRCERSDGTGRPVRVSRIQKEVSTMLPSRAFAQLQPRSEVVLNHVAVSVVSPSFSALLSVFQRGINNHRSYKYG